MRARGALIFALCVSACAHAPVREAASLGWMTGCWETARGDYREVWRAEGGHVFGFAVAYKDGAEVFFEQTRIDLGAPAIFNAYPAGKAPSAFAESERAPGRIVFANPSHDYPQKIAYARDGEDLNAIISLANGERAETFEFRPCAD